MVGRMPYSIPETIPSKWYPIMTLLYCNLAILLKRELSFKLGFAFFSQFVLLGHNHAKSREDYGCCVGLLHVGEAASYSPKAVVCAAAATPAFERRRVAYCCRIPLLQFDQQHFGRLHLVLWDIHHTRCNVQLGLPHKGGSRSLPQAPIQVPLPMRIHVIMTMTYRLSWFIPQKYSKTWSTWSLASRLCLRRWVTPRGRWTSRDVCSQWLWLSQGRCAHFSLCHVISTINAWKQTKWKTKWREINLHLSMQLQHNVPILTASQWYCAFIWRAIERKRGIWCDLSGVWWCCVLIRCE